MAPIKRKYYRTLESKILIPVFILLFLLPAGILLLVNHHFKQQAFAGAEKTLQSADAVFRNSLQLKKRNLTLTFEHILTEPKIRETLIANDTDLFISTLKSSIEGYEVEVESLFYSSSAGVRHFCESENPGKIEDFAEKTTVSTNQALAGKNQAGMLSLPGEVLYVISLPVYHSAESKEPEGAITVGIQFNQEQIWELRSLTFAELMIHTGDTWQLGSLAESQMEALPADLDDIQNDRAGSIVPLKILEQNFHVARGTIAPIPGSSNLNYILLASYEADIKALNKTRSVLINLSVISIGLSIFAIWSLIRRFIGPLKALRDGAEAVGTGDFEHVIDVHTDDECGDLAYSFNRMTQNLNVSHTKLNDTVKELQTTQNQLIEREAKLRESEQGLRLIIEGARDHVIFTIDQQGYIARWNHTAAKHLGYSVNAAQQLPYATLFTEEDCKSKKPEEILQTALEAGQARWEGWRLRQDGSTFWASVTISLLPGADGSEVGNFVEIARDVTDRKEAEIAMRQARDAAEASNRAKSEFLGNMSHELRTPMNGIIGMATLLSTSDLQKEESQMSATIRSSAEALLEVIDNILDISNLEAGSIEVIRKPTELGKLLENSVRDYSGIAEEKGLKIDLEVSADLPETIHTDSHRLTQALGNIIDNAVKFTDTGGIKIRAERSANDLRQIEIITQDTGCGIPPDSINKIFQPFQQADNSASRKHGGTGLGLPISQKLVSLLKGHCEVESTVGIGSCFTISLPINEASFTKVKKPTTQNKAALPVIKTKKQPAQQYPLKILLAEDNPVNAKVAGLMLKKLGYTYDLAKNGKEAVEACQSKIYDIILMDLQMPEMGGLEATEKILQEADRSLPYVIALTANVSTEDRERCDQVGMRDFLEKPAKPELIASSLMRAYSTMQAET